MNDTDREAVETLLSMSRQRDRMQQVTSSDEEESSCSSSSLHWDESSQDENKDRNKLMSYSAKVGVLIFLFLGAVVIEMCYITYCTLNRTGWSRALLHRGLLVRQLLLLCPFR